MPDAGLDARLAPRLAQLRARDRYRTRRVIDGGHGIHAVVDGRRLVNFCSNDYLGLATHPQVRAAAQAALSDGCGSTASPLLGGHNRHHRALEDALAEATGYPRALLFTSGWAANMGVLRALLGRDDLLIADELNHASLIDGGRLSGARYRRVAHGDLAGFAAALDAADRQVQRMVVTDSVFSMDGDLAPLSELRVLTRRAGADLMVDDAHGFGVLGTRGGGIVEHLGEAVRPEVYVATLGKSLGSAGAFVAGSETLIEYLIQRARSWVFSTAPPPALSAAALAALRIVQGDPERRAHLHALIARFRAGTAGAGLELMPSTTPIQPLLIGADADALAVSAKLMDAGYWVAAIRPPTVPEGTSRLRITLSAAHTEAEVDGLVAALAGAYSACAA
ncbi:8-amino-7-oxononanoate synthase [Polycyclovorans algicola]|uniref:8-amino-7-oxononanoate synthase n=1 Tax=Polycyclovorans algicola TaxID=616992 RepID=UPI000AE99A01|nr:8-amino-7-oxononanoate synthase [Polycyclovorans algicola]